jgi:hypothetical protein
MRTTWCQLKVLDFFIGKIPVLIVFKSRANTGDPFESSV